MTIDESCIIKGHTLTDFNSRNRQEDFLVDSMTKQKINTMEDRYELGSDY
jgi:hypothetical protein